MKLKNAGRMMKMLLRITVVTCWFRRMKLRVGGREGIQRGGDAEEEDDQEEKRVGEEESDVLGHFDAHLRVRGGDGEDAHADAAEDRFQLEDNVLAGHETEEGDECINENVYELREAEAIELRLGGHESTSPTS